MSGEIAWLEGLSPWPEDGFGLERMRSLLAALGDPQNSFPAIHVVGTNGKSTATLTIEQILLADGLSVGSTISPHIRDWSERLRIDGGPGDLVAALRPRAAGRRAGWGHAVRGDDGGRVVGLRRRRGGCRRR